MQDAKRRFVAAAALAAAAFPLAAFAQDSYPVRPVKIVVGFPTGSSTDVAIRVLAERLGQQLGQQFVVDNKPGASSNIAARLVTSSPADGYTLFVGTIANTISAPLQPAVSVDIGKEFLPVAMVGSVPNVLVAHPALGVKTMQELVAKAKAQPKQITYASSGNGTSPHLSGELFAHMAGVEMLHVPYRGSSPAVVDLLAGQVNAMFAPASTVLPHIRAGKLVPLASAGLQRTESLPDVPTVIELGLKGFETSVWFGINAPLNTPAAVIERLRAGIAAAQDSAELKQQFKAQGIDVVKADPRAYGEWIRAETAKWTQVIKTAGVQP